MRLRSSAAATAAALLCIVLVASGVPTAASGGAALAQPDDGSGTSTITVATTGSVEAEPDRAVVTVAVVARDANATGAAAQVAANASALRSALDASDLPIERVRTTDYSLFEHRSDDRPQRAPTFVAAQEFAIELSNVSAAGPTVDEAIAGGATEIRDVRFALSADRERQLRTRALGVAVADARVQADALASNLNQTITGVESASTAESSIVPVQPVHFEAADSAGTVIDGGPVTVSATVTVTYNATG